MLGLTLVLLFSLSSVLCSRRWEYSDEGDRQGHGLILLAAYKVRQITK